MKKKNPTLETKAYFRGLMVSYDKLLPESKEYLNYLIGVFRREIQHELQITQELRKKAKSLPDSS